MSAIRFLAAVTLLSILVVGPPVFASDEIRKERVQFKKGATTATIKGKIKGTPYHATGPLPCTMGNDKPVQCEFGVIRGKPGNAEVHITPPGGLKRVLIFMGDKVTTNPGEKIKARYLPGPEL
jgi:hypothetical protein